MFRNEFGGSRNIESIAKWKKSHGKRKPEYSPESREPWGIFSSVQINAWSQWGRRGEIFRRVLGEA